MRLLQGIVLGALLGLVTLNILISRKIMTEQEQLAQDLRDLKDQNDKARAEVVQKIADLEAAIAAGGGTVTQEVKDAVLALKGSVQADDDIVPG